MGAVADGLNAVIYAAEGDYANAALSAVAMIPGIGDSIALASKGAKVMKGLMKEGATFLKNFDYKGAWKNAKEKVKHFFGIGKCFTGDTLVYAEKGYIPIRDIQKGDSVWSMNEETGETGLKKVEEVFCTEAHTIHEITIEGKEVIKATAYHPFYVSEKGWVNAINLEVGDRLVIRDGMTEITQLSKSRHDEPVNTYNFHVEDWTSYFVSDRNVYVHNPDGDHGEDTAKTLKEWLENETELLEEARKWYENSPEWWSIDPDNTPVFYRNQQEVEEIRKLSGESGGHHPHGLGLGGPKGQELTKTNETRKNKNVKHNKVTGFQRKIINVLKRLGRK